MTRRYAFAAALCLLVGGCNSNNGKPGGSGFIEATESVVSAETVGRVIALRIDEGSQVKPGDTLLVIDPSRVELDSASLAAARQATVASLAAIRLQAEKARLAQKYAESERDRVASLLASGTATKKQFDQVDFEASQATNARQTAEANVVVTQRQIEKIDADINRLNRQIIDCYPTAPVSGVVTEKYTDIGEMLSPGKAIAKISRLDTVWAKVYLPAGLFAEVKIGDPAAVSTESGGSSYQGIVTWTSDEAEFTPKNVQTEKSRTDLVYAVKVSIPNSDGKLKIGMPVFITLESQ